MDENLKKKIQERIEQTIIEKIKKYEPETTYNPFISSFFDIKSLKRTSFIHSFYTTLGVSIYEQIGEIIAQSQGYYVERQYKMEGHIDENTSKFIDELLNNNSYTPDKQNEIQEIRKRIKPFEKQFSKSFDNIRTVDLFIKKCEKEIYIDIASPKLNYKEFTSLKKKMLQWVALRLSKNNKANIETYIGIPFNPYYPEPYNRWTGSYCDQKGDLLIQEELWKEIAEENIYKELIEIFKQSGKNLNLQLNLFLQHLEKSDIPKKEELECDVKNILDELSSEHLDSSEIDYKINSFINKLEKLFFISDKVENINYLKNKIIGKGKQNLTIKEEKILRKILHWGIIKINGTTIDFNLEKRKQDFTKEIKNVKRRIKKKNN